MTRNWFRSILVFSLLCTVIQQGWADDREDLLKKVEILKKQAAAQAEAGKLEQAQELKRQALKLLVTLEKAAAKRREDRAVASERSQKDGNRKEAISKAIAKKRAAAAAQKGGEKEAAERRRRSDKQAISGKQREAYIKELTALRNKLRKQLEELGKRGTGNEREIAAKRLREAQAKIENAIRAQQRNGEAGEGKKREGERREGQRREGERREGERREGQRREGERKINPEIRASINRLEHIRAAIGHLKEAGLTELVQVAGQRGEQLQAAIAKSTGRRVEGREGRERERDEDRRGEGNVLGALRELSQAIRQLQAEMKTLRGQVNELRKD
jgi:hypothetical protein